MTISEALTEAGFGMGWSVVKALPEPAAQRLFRQVADRTWDRQGPSVLQLKANLARVLDDADLANLDAIAHEGVRSYMRYWCEVFRLPAWGEARIRQDFTLENRHFLDDALAQGGAIAAMPHMGNWDLAGAWATLEYGGLATVAERLKPEGLFDKFVRYRESLGMVVLPLGDPDSLRVLVRHLRDGKLVCLLADRDLSHGGIPVSFFGEAASMPAGPALLSVMTGAPLIPGGLWTTPTGNGATLGAPIAIPEGVSRQQQVATMTQQLADYFAGSIAAHPSDWHMMQPLFRADLGRRSAK